jgi:hypothetical protein
MDINCTPLFTGLFLIPIWGRLLPMASQEERQKINPDLLFQLPLYRRCSVTEQFSIRLLFVFHLSKWAWSTGYYWHSKVYFSPWHSHCIRQQRKIKNKTWRVHFSNGQFHVCGVYNSQLTRYFSTCDKYNHFLYKTSIQLTQNLLRQNLVVPRLKSLLKHSTPVIANWLTITKYLLSNANVSFSFLLFFYNWKDFSGLNCE